MQKVAWTLPMPHFQPWNPHTGVDVRPSLGLIWDPQFGIDPRPSLTGIDLEPHIGIDLESHTGIILFSHWD